MPSRKSLFRGLGLLSGTFLFLALAPVPSALASTAVSVPVSITPGTMYLDVPSIVSTFPGFVLNGQVQTGASTLTPWKVVDATGTGDGWSVTISGTPLTELTPPNGFQSGTSPLVLPKGSLSLVAGGTVTAEPGSTPVSSTGGPFFENVGSVVDGGSFTVLKADNGYGMGTYDITPTSNSLNLTLNPSSTEVDQVNYPGQPTPYGSTLTFSLVSGPAPALGVSMSGMSGVEIPANSSLSAPSSLVYSGSVDDVFYATSSESEGVVLREFTGAIQAVFPSSTYIDAVNLELNSSPASSASITVQGEVNGVWETIGSTTYSLPDSPSIMEPSLAVTPGDYSGISIEESNSASWVAFDHVTIN